MFRNAAVLFMEWLLMAKGNEFTEGEVLKIKSKHLPVPNTGYTNKIINKDLLFKDIAINQYFILYMLWMHFKNQKCYLNRIRNLN